MGVMFEALFDSCPGSVGKVRVEENSIGMEVKIVGTTDTTVLVSTARDQWGVFVTAGSITVAQEDGTRSFLDALIRALIVLRKSCEAGTLPATVTVDGYPSTETDIAHITDIPFR